MGVIEKLGGRAPVLSVSVDSINSLGISQPATPSESETVDDESPVIVPLRRNPGQLLRRLENHGLNRHTGARKIRRANNTRALQTLIEDESEETIDVSITDLQPNSQNAFTRLFNSDDDMRVWQYFINLNEKEQRKYLEATSPKRQTSNGRAMDGITFTQVAVNPNDHGEWKLTEIKGLKPAPSVSDCHRVHPACSEALRFSMMEPQLQSILKKKHLPLGVLSNLEQEIRETFITNPSAVLRNPDLTSFERLLIHALCQYNFLTSKSKNKAGVRMVTVENIEKCFHAPEMSLTQYIETYYRS